MSKLEQLVHEAESLSEKEIDTVLEFIHVMRGSESPNETFIAAHSALAKDWLSPEEDEAWANL